MSKKSVKRPLNEIKEKCAKVVKLQNGEKKSKDLIAKDEEKLHSADYSKDTLVGNNFGGSSGNSYKYPPWIVHMAKQAGISLELCNILINFFEADATIPFLARYRSSKIQGKSAEELRIIKDIYRTMKQVNARATFIKKTLASKNLLSNDFEYHIDNAQSMAELEELYEPYKTSKKSKIQQAEELGIVQNIKHFLERKSTFIKLNDLVNPKCELTKDEKAAKQLILAVSADIMLKDVELIPKVTEIYSMSKEKVYIISKKNTNKKKETTQNSSDKFENYYNFQRNYNAIRPHQILAINRGEDQKELKVSIELPRNWCKIIENFLWNKWLKNMNKSDFMFDIVKNATNTVVMEKLKKKIIRRIRAELTSLAEKASLTVFTSNLKWMLLTQPVSNHTVLAIDPGFTGGCKIAVVSPDQKVLDTSLCHLSNFNFTTHLKTLICKQNVSLIAIGNGKGCRETENYVGDMLKNLRKEGIDIPYTIVSEQGVSIYSCSEDATKEYPELSPNMISAVSLAKRVIDPLGEMIKVNPKNLGVGMYQHDLQEKRLEEMVHEVVSEVVSIVGVNLNTAPLRLLMQVAGLTSSRAKALIDYRMSNGPFKQRNQITKVKGIGKKTFEQCAGFVRILPQGEDGDEIQEPLDQTIIHPEDYAAATKFIKQVCVLDKKDIGKEDFIKDVKRSIELGGKSNICNLLEIDESTFDVIYEGLTQALHYDVRMEFAEQLFRKEVNSFDQLKEGQMVTGRIENVTNFGSFVDIGVGNSTLLPASQAANENSLHYGQKILVKVREINFKTQKVTLDLVNILSK